ncbi:MAG TPA: hypothetical protein IAB51_07850 [Candidatus Merdivicinus excrementipullorum]|uniref:Uncharacterized protein n=1 Tax=Candidatus Merdivicinus excrementipullorum TaxID=2840867 RepID=A0A9D1FP12_9FIRM|nr:hypothetical protein [Candidatus Merdivicinus excrementipullorum]
MGYDVSFHPISSKEMEEWYFTPLEWVRQGQEKKALELVPTKITGRDGNMLEEIK